MQISNDLRVSTLAKYLDVKPSEISVDNCKTDTGIHYLEHNNKFHLVLTNDEASQIVEEELYYSIWYRFPEIREFVKNSVSIDKFIKTIINFYGIANVPSDLNKPLYITNDNIYIYDAIISVSPLTEQAS